MVALLLPVAAFATLAYLARSTDLASLFPIGFTLGAIGLAALALATSVPHRGARSRASRGLRALAGAIVGIFLIIPAAVRWTLVDALWPVAIMGAVVFVQVAVACRRLAVGFRHSRQGLLARIEEAIAEALNPVFAKVVVLELSLLHSAITQWRTDQAAIEAEARFSYERSFRASFLAIGGIFLCLATALHIAASIEEKWYLFAIAAIADILFLYVLATWKSFWLLPAYLSKGRLVLRTGHLSSVDLCLDQVKSVALSAGARAGAPPDEYLSFSLFRRPNVAIQLREPTQRPQSGGHFKVILGRIDDPVSFVRTFESNPAL